MNAAGFLARGGGGTIVASRSGAAFVQMSDGPVLAILPPATPVHPWAISVAVDPASLRVGTRVRIGASVLALGTTLVPLRDAQTIDLQILERPADPPIRSMWHIVNRPRAGANSGRQGGGGDSAERTSVESLEPPYAAPLEEYSARGDMDGLLRILGLGKGLTPSGDDALVGLLAGLDFLQDGIEGVADERSDLVSLLVPELEAATSVFSASLIAAAAEGQYAEPIIDLLDEVARADVMPASLDWACARLLEVGHDSGASILDGIRASFKRVLSLDPGRPVAQPVPGS